MEDGGLRDKLKLKPKLLAAINFNYGYNCRRVREVAVAVVARLV